MSRMVQKRWEAALEREDRRSLRDALPCVLRSCSRGLGGGRDSQLMGESGTFSLWLRNTSAISEPPATLRALLPETATLQSKGGIWKEKKKKKKNKDTILYALLSESVLLIPMNEKLLQRQLSL